MKNKFISVSTSSFLLISCLANGANAGSITNTANDSFIDDSTDLEWMDFGVNNGRSYNDVVANLASSGDYYGWSLPSTEQIEQLWDNIFYSTGRGPTHQPDSHYYSFEENLNNIEISPGRWGNNWSSIPEIIGYNHETHLALEDHYFGLGWFEDNGLQSYTYYWNGDYKAAGMDTINDRAYVYGVDLHYDPDGTSPVYSTMLVKQVPEPLTLSIFALSIMGLGLRRYKKK